MKTMAALSGALTLALGAGNGYEAPPAPGHWICNMPV
jgi:hypothetical protein